MDPLTIGLIVGGGTTLLGIVWALVRRLKPRWARRVETWLPRAESAAWKVFEALELLGAFVPGVDKRTEALRRWKRDFVDPNGVPTGIDDIEEQFDEWAATFALEKKALEDQVYQRLRSAGAQLGDMRARLEALHLPEIRFDE